MSVPTLAAFPSSQPFPPLFPVYCTCPMISSASQQQLAGVHGEKEGGAGQFPKLVIQALSAALRGSHRVDACAKLAERLDPVSHRPRASRSRIWRWDQPINGPSLSVGCFEPRSTCGIPPLGRKDPFTHRARGSETLGRSKTSQGEGSRSSTDAFGPHRRARDHSRA